MRRNPDGQFLGTREVLKTEMGTNARTGKPEEVKTLGKYEWKTFQEAHDESEAIAKYIMHNELVTPVEMEGEDYLFMGIYAKNCEEWMLTDLACVQGNLTSVCLYDTLGA